jgi:hypothetical protein
MRCNEDFVEDGNELLTKVLGAHDFEDKKRPFTQRRQRALRRVGLFRLTADLRWFAENRNPQDPSQSDARPPDCSSQQRIDCTANCKS